MKTLDRLFVAAVGVIALAGVALAEDAAPSSSHRRPGAAEGGAAAAECKDGPDCTGTKGMMGMMHHRGARGCPMMGAGMTAAGACCGGLAEPGVDVKVEKRDDGVVLTLTSKDPKVARRVQKRAEILRLRQELAEDEPPPAP